jgi:hypothetical protein
MTMDRALRAVRQGVAGGFVIVDDYGALAN